MQGGSRLRIVGYRIEYAQAFADLNYEWIEKYYSVESHDREILDDPEAFIINKGGQIFIALEDGEPVGAVALIRAGDRVFELAKMAVSPKAQGKGIGALLISACVDYSTAQGMNEIILESNTRQEAALHLYRKAGFEEIELDPNSPYTRANIRMRLAL